MMWGAFRPTEPVRDGRPTADHPYVFTVAGRCAQCQRHEVEHPKMLAAPDPMTECTVDHRSINTALLIGDGGWEWRRCPYCHVQVEGALRTGEVVGPAYGPGRGDMTHRLKARLTAWFGWVQFNGGDA